jgi:hypothetical protein
MQPEDDATRLALDKSVGELSKTLKTSFGIRSPMCKWPHSVFFFNSATGCKFRGFVGPLLKVLMIPDVICLFSMLVPLSVIEKELLHL